MRRSSTTRQLICACVLGAFVLNFPTDDSRGQEISPLGLRGAIEGKDEIRSDGNQITESDGINIKVVGGTDVSPLNFPSVVRIKFRKNGSSAKSICTGIMIDIDVALTAAHCACGILSSYEVILQRPAGQTKIQKLKGLPKYFQQGICRLIRQKKILPGKDLALLPLQGNIIGSGEVSHIAHMIDVVKDKAAIRLVVLGWGKNETGNRSEENLGLGHIGILSHLCSKNQFGCKAFQEFILSNPLSGVSAVQTDSCQGDSGGPV